SLLLSLIVQIPFVQNWIVNRISHKISKDLETEVRVGHFYLNFFDDVTITDFLIRDQKGDTLLFSGRLYVDLYQPVKLFTSNKLSFEEVEIENVSCRLETDADGSSNYAFIAEYLSKDQVETTVDPSAGKMQVEFRSTLVGLQNVHYSQIDSSTGKALILSLPEGATTLDQRSGDPLSVDFVSLISPRITLESFPFTPQSLEVADKDNNAYAAVDTVATSGFAFDLRKLIITSGILQIQDSSMPKASMRSVIRFTDFEGYDLNLIAENLHYVDGTGSASLSNLTMKTKEGFRIDRLRSNLIEFDKTHIVLKELLLETPNSSLANQFELKFRSTADFDDFANKVIVNADFSDSYIALRDILYFSEKLNDNEFFILNGGHRIDLQGKVNGRVNNFRCRNFSLSMANRATLAGNLSLKNVLVKGEELLNLDLTRADFSMNTLRQLIPDFGLPANFDKLGNLHFEGRFDGFFQDFVAFGALQTNLGALRTDMRMDVNDEVDAAQYSGNIELIDFDLREWTGSDLFGKASFNASVTDGVGLSRENASATLSAKLDNFFFKDYVYKNAQLNGVLNKSLFDGVLEIDDQHVSLDFNGTVDFSDSVPKFDFYAGIDHIDFEQLNFSDRNISAEGYIDFNFELYDLFNLDGTITGSDLRLQRDGAVYAIDTLQLFSSVTNGEEKLIQLSSNIISADLRGDFDLEKIPNTFYKLLQEKHPQVVKRFGMSKVITTDQIVDNDFEFTIAIENSQSVQKLIDPELPDIIDLTASGVFRNTGDQHFEYSILMETPLLTFNDKSVHNINIDLATEGDKSQ
ncbi:MAG: hypothetical protein OEQ53_20915, partial [Saprospiraceae bacterium]|nr:hypothetical protein [Saprospiraceae bacterium]